MGKHFSSIFCAVLTALVCANIACAGVGNSATFRIGATIPPSVESSLMSPALSVESLLIAQSSMIGRGPVIERSVRDDQPVIFQSFVTD